MAMDTTLLDDAPTAGERCRYPSKFCRHRRSLKRNGDLHRFCDHHRAKANDNQKRWSKSRRGAVASPGSDVASPPLWAAVADAIASDQQREEDELLRLADAPSFTSMLAMLQPRAKPKMPADDQLGDLLRELLAPPPYGDPTVDPFTANDHYATLVQL